MDEKLPAGIWSRGGWTAMAEDRSMEGCGDLISFPSYRPYRTCPKPYLLDWAQPQRHCGFRPLKADDDRPDFFTLDNITFRHPLIT